MTRLHVQVQAMADLLADEQGHIATGAISLNRKFFTSGRRVRALLQLIDDGLVLSPEIVKTLSGIFMVEKQVYKIWPEKLFEDDKSFSETRFLFMIHARIRGDLHLNERLVHVATQQALRAAEQAQVTPATLRMLVDAFFYDVTGRWRSLLMAHADFAWPLPHADNMPAPNFGPDINMAYLERQLLFSERWLPAQVSADELVEAKQFTPSVMMNFYAAQWSGGYEAYWAAKQGNGVQSSPYILNPRPRASARAS